MESVYDIHFMSTVGQRHCRTTNRIHDRQKVILSMKPKIQIEKPVEQVMKFFTPELLARFNSTDDAVADRANDEWEAAVEAYRLHLENLCDQVPDSVRTLGQLCLHDAEVVEENEGDNPPISLDLPGNSITLTLKQGNKTVILGYVLGDSVRRYPSGEEERFSTAEEHRIWLYDELDVSPESTDGHPPSFLHRVLFSDGVILEIPFRSIRIVRITGRSGQGR